VDVLTPFAVVTLIVVVPGATACATPLVLIVATPTSLLSHVNVVLVTFADASRAVAVNAWFVPTIADAGFGAIETVVAGFGIAGQACTGVALFRGVGGLIEVKSAELLPLMVQPAPLRITEFVALGAAVDVPQFVPVPKLTWSTVPVGHAPDSATVV
jgi:hypothetical protein